MSIFDLMNYFWLRNENEPCSLSEIALHNYLLFEANRQHWVMPFKVSTQMIQARLNTSKQNVMKARDGLARKGIINFTKGEGKGRPAVYTLLLRLPSDKLDTQLLPQTLSQPLAQTLTQSLTDELTQTLPSSKIKEENTQYFAEKKATPSPPQTVSKVVLTLPELQEKLLKDEQWLLDLKQRLVAANISLGLDELKGKIIDFFDEQQNKGVEEKDEADCRKYVYNWIKYHHNNKKNYGQNSRNENKGGRADISANRPEDYQGSC